MLFGDSCGVTIVGKLGIGQLGVFRATNLQQVWFKLLCWSGWLNVVSGFPAVDLDLASIRGHDGPNLWMHVWWTVGTKSFANFLTIKDRGTVG